MERLGIISGTLDLRGRLLPEEGTWETQDMETVHGPARVHLSRRIAWISRHGDGDDGYVLPHRINHAANLDALRQAGVRDVIGVNSTGTLRPDWKPGTLVVPDDYLCLYGGATAVIAEACHITPSLDAAMREQLIRAARECGETVVAGGVYWQTPGPRLETRAEIRWMSRAADLVGMTMANEAAVAQEMGLAYASLCSVDNYAHGFVMEALTQEAIITQARKNVQAVSRILDRLLASRAA